MKTAGIIREGNNADNIIEIDNRGWQPHITQHLISAKYLRVRTKLETLSPPERKKDHTSIEASIKIKPLAEKQNTNSVDNTISGLNSVVPSRVNFPKNTHSTKSLLSSNVSTGPVRTTRKPKMQSDESGIIAIRKESD